MKFKKVFLFLVLFISVFVISGCGKKEEPYTKEVETYYIKHSNLDKLISFEFMKSDDYTVIETNGSIRFINNLNNSKIELYYLYDYPVNKTITKEKKDFTLKSYNNFKKYKKKYYGGWSIYQTNDFVTNYEINLILTEPDQNDKVYAVYIKVIDSPIKIDEYPFDTKEFVEKADFKHLIDTLKIVNEKDLEKETVSKSE